MERKGELSDETITLEELESLGFNSFNQLIPYLERLEETDLAYRRDREDASQYEPLLLPDSLDPVPDPSDDQDPLDDQDPSSSP